MADNAHFINIIMKKLLLFISLCIALCGCKSQEKLAYFSENRPADHQIIANTGWKIKIEPNDELLITVNSELPEVTAIYNLPTANPSKLSELNSPGLQGQLQTYIVDRAGNIKFPVFGTIHVEGMTTAELAELITQKVAKDVEAPYVRVELLNFKINVLGEVTRPGTYEIRSERVSILDALAQAGDLTIFGKRDNVTLIREEDGKITYNTINLNDSKLIESPYYYLKQNDAIYVEPTETRKGQAEYNQNNAFKVSVISAIISGVSVIASLVIALAIK